MNKRNRTVRSIICVLLSFIILFSVISIPSGKAEAAGSNIDDFITSCYRICLNREPSQADLEHWEGELLRGERCGSDAVFCFVFGPEYVGLNKSDEEFVEDMYRTFLLREYDAPGKEFWMKKFSEERWSREQVFAGFANSDEFFGLCLSYGITAGYFDSNYDHEQINKVNTFVARLYKICLNRIGDKKGQKDWVVSLLSNENSGMKCAEGFIKSAEYRGLKLSEEQYVENMYKLMLGRDSDEGGKAHWLNNLAHGMSKDALFYSFARSVEFTNICKDYGIVSINEEIPSAKPDGTFIMYFSGIDADGANPSMNHNSDVNILAVVNTKTRHIQLIHTPRDYYVNTPYGEGQKDKLTHAGLYGIENSIGTMETLYGINIDYYFKTNFTGFVNIVDGLGGVEVYSDYDFSVDPIKHYTQGYNTLSGIEALAFVRERKSFNDPTNYRHSGDFQRGLNQLHFFTGMVRKVCAPDFLFNYTSVCSNIKNSYSTDFTDYTLATLVAEQISDNSEWKVDRYVLGANEIREEYTYTNPSQAETVVIPSDADVAIAKELIYITLNEEE